MKIFFWTGEFIGEWLDRERNNKGGTDLFGAFHRYGSSKFLHDLFSDGKAESGAGSIAGKRVLHLEEFFENGSQMRFRDADAGIGDLDGQTVVFCARLDGDLSLLRSVLDGVSDDVRQHLLELDPVRFSKTRCKGDVLFEGLGLRKQHRMER